MRKQIKEGFDEAGIEIPYPHTVEISKGEFASRSSRGKSASELINNASE